MKTIAIIIAAFMLTTGLSAQDNAAKTKAGNDGASRKEKRKTEMEANFLKTKGILNSKQFVVEADWLGNSWGSRIPVTSNLNFISIDSVEAIIQTGNNSLFGPNGLGGVTAKGSISSWKMNVNEKNKSVSIKLNVLSPVDTFTVFMNVSASGNVTADINGIRAGKLYYYGRIVPLEESHAYAGSSF